MQNVQEGTPKNRVLYYFVQFVCHASHPISRDPGNNFLSILAEFGDLSEKLLITCIYELNEMVQYKELLVIKGTQELKSRDWEVYAMARRYAQDTARLGEQPNLEAGSCGYVIYQYFLPAAVERFIPEVVTSNIVLSHVTRSDFAGQLYLYVKPTLSDEPRNRGWVETCVALITANE
jgi:hypothetical protein